MINNSNVCFNQFVILWKPSIGDLVCGNVTSYEVILLPPNRKKNVTDTITMFSNLDESTTYTVEVSGINLAGIGESSSVTVTTESRGTAISQSKQT